MDLKTQFNDHVNQRRDETYNALVVNYKPSRRIPESVFLKNFYAFFKGEVKDKQEAMAVHKNWVDVAGSPFETVTIIDNTGREVYEVPPMAATDAVRTIVKEEKGLIFNAAAVDVKNANMEAQTPYQKDSLVHAALSKNVVYDQSAVVAYADKWKKLIEFFDERLGLVDKKQEEKKSNKLDAKALHDSLF